jgi:hypothetical protein
MRKLENQTKPIDDVELVDCTPLIRGCLTTDPRMPIGLKMSVGLARLLTALLREHKHNNTMTLLYVDVLEQALALQSREEQS